MCAASDLNLVFRFFSKKKKSGLLVRIENSNSIGLANTPPAGIGTGRSGCDRFRSFF